ncbi:TIM21-domain-containing protein [Boeremia exigua]|uniref:TIM21-domain-containing protein n=1 Tax=Boeremia exigua TaxID=749465 RepID=UPI001E8EC4BC|nr:TIM21-domain-containing protein [Boeremia exigua]KAH6611892.1 TIM21-domain-containing protein [Boeremia exigua]
MAALYRPAEAALLLRPAMRPALLLPRIQPSAARRALSASHQTRATEPTYPGTPIPQPARRSITLTGDSGQVPWTALSPGEKVVRTTQQSFNLIVVVIGVVATGGVTYFLFHDVFSPNSKIAHFNHATDRIRDDPRCQKLLGEGSQISAYGESSLARYVKNRAIRSTEETDQWGTQHLKFRFFVEGNGKQGVVHVHMIKKPSMSSYEYAELALDVKGHRRIDLASKEKQAHVAPKIFGARWW